MSNKQWVFDNLQEAADLIEHLQQRNSELAHKLSKEQELHKMTYSLMKSGELRGVQKAEEELKPKIDELAATVERLELERDSVCHLNDELSAELNQLRKKSDE